MSMSTNLNFEAGIASLPPNLVSFWGFRSGEGGAHSSRTIMLEEFSQLLGAVAEDASRQDYAHAAVVGNCLAKRTAANRRISLQRLAELYGLDRRLALFRVLRELWAWQEASRPLLAFVGSGRKGREVCAHFSAPPYGWPRDAVDAVLRTEEDARAWAAKTERSLIEQVKQGPIVVN